MSDWTEEIYTKWNSNLVAKWPHDPTGPAPTGVRFWWNSKKPKPPVYTMGSPNPRAFTCGPRKSISGVMIFEEDYRWSYTDPKEDYVKFYGGGNARPTTKESAEKIWAYQLPYATLHIEYTNEYGQLAHRWIFGVEFWTGEEEAKEIRANETITFFANDLGLYTPEECLPKDCPCIVTAEDEQNGQNDDK